MHTSKSDAARAEMAADAPALTAVPREPVAKEQHIEESVAGQVVIILYVRQPCQALRSHRKRCLATIGRSDQKK